MPQLTEEQFKKSLANPFYAITIHESLCAEHEPMVTKDEWVKSAMQSIKNDGVEVFLHRLLDVLEGNYT